MNQTDFVINVEKAFRNQAVKLGLPMPEFYVVEGVDRSEVWSDRVDLAVPEDASQLCSGREGRRLFARYLCKLESEEEHSDHVVDLIAKMLES